MRHIIGYMLIGMGLAYIITLVIRMIKYIITNNSTPGYKAIVISITIVCVLIELAAFAVLGWIMMKFIA